MILERIDDSMNPIVVKELRQAVQSRFVVAVLLLFLLVQLVVMGLFVMTAGYTNRLAAADFQMGREVFLWLQGILLATCLLFIPLYTGVRLAAERSDYNVDLLFITTLRPRYIVSGKFQAAVVLAILIFSACTPFMAFTYFLRGIDLPSIFFVVGLDFVAVLGAVMMTIFVAVIPANRVLKSLLGALCAAALFLIFSLTLTGSMALLQFGLASLSGSRAFFAECAVVLVYIFGAIGLFYAWAVGLVSSPSANRALPSRLALSLFLVVSGVISVVCSLNLEMDGPVAIWIAVALGVLSLYLWIAINERDHWGPRVARTIPQNRLLRLPAWLLYTGAGGGISFVLLWFGVIGLAVYYWLQLGIVPVRMRGVPDFVTQFFQIWVMLFVYTYCYALTARLTRALLLPRVQAGATWVVMLILVALGCAVPYLLSFLVHWRDWRFDQHYYWLLTNPITAMFAMGERFFPGREAFLYFALFWAGSVTILNVPWFFAQLRRFKPYVPPAPHQPAPHVGPALETTQALSSP